MQRCLCKGLNLLLRVERDPHRRDIGGRQAGLLVSSAHAGGAGEFRVGDARGVAQQIMYRDLPYCGDRGAGGIGGIDQDLHLAESRNEFAHRVSQLQLALFNHHHGQHRHHGLGHGIGTKHTVTLQGFALGRVLQTDRFSMDHRAFACNQEHRARHALCIDFSLNDGAYAS